MPRSSAGQTDESTRREAARLDPWGEPVDTGQAAGFKSRADTAAREEAARFAVWGEDSTSEVSSHPSLSGGAAASGLATPFDPWHDATLDMAANTPS